MEYQPAYGLTHGLTSDRALRRDRKAFDTWMVGLHHHVGERLMVGQTIRAMASGSTRLAASGMTKARVPFMHRTGQDRTRHGTCQKASGPHPARATPHTGRRLIHTKPRYV